MKSVTGEKLANVAIGVSDEQSLIDTNADTNKYIGVASPGAATSDQAWTITRITSTNPQQITNAPKNSIWDNRTGLIYS